ncbi:tail assembly chaperone [Mycobacterium phage Indlulamithi]|uniref:Tail assembly chaperone n=1 Tax=Mycobacterium phage Indlulamithi TaxID=2656582 RepID=A0A649VE55_9CAUD|nr:tail assembly chaperone [Mycobacterium phage Indlulamithi]QGJ90063.1 tail assembly chaperone [Mycobacterium phage Indlulamithi]
MSYPGVDPVDEIQSNPVGTQVDSSTGHPDPEKPNPLIARSIVEDEIADAERVKAAIKENEVREAAAKAVQDMFAVTSWQPSKTVKFMIQFQSGQNALVKHLNTMDLMRAKLIEDLDFFTKKLFPSAIDQAGNPVEKEEDSQERRGIWAVLEDPEKRAKFLDMTNRLMVAASVKPKIVNDGVALRDDPDNPGEKVDVFGHEIESIDEQIELFGKPVPVLKEGEAYAGTIDLNDRMVFFQELNKPLELIEPFREGSDAVLASLEPVQSSPVQAEQPV